MILESLAAYYETLLARGVSGVPRSGWSAAKVSYGLELSPDGALIGLLPLKVPELRGTKQVEVPQLLTVPFQQEKGAGLNPNFLCDNALFLLGLDTRGKPERALKSFEATRDLHLALLADAEGPAARAVAAFFRQWDPAAAAAHPLLKEKLEELAAGNLVFRLDGAYIHNDPELIQIWQAYYDRPEEGDVVLPCLVTGKPSPIARTHPIIRGIRGAPTTGSKLVGFNDTAYESYGKSQSYNAPVSKYAAFAYSTALNALLADTHHKKIIGDMTVVYWAQSGESVYQDMLSSALDPTPDVDDEILDHVMKNLACGRAVECGNFRINEDMPFYILGLAPNAARVMIRFFYSNTFGALMEHLTAHYRRLQIVRPSYDTTKYLSVRTLVRETISKQSSDKKGTPKLAEDLLRSILFGTPYPPSLIRLIHVRIHSDGIVNRCRAAAIKAYMIRDGQIQEGTMEQYETTNTDIAYLLGSLFAVYERIQFVANPNINANIHDTYFNQAKDSPQAAFDRLDRLATVQLRQAQRRDIKKASLLTNDVTRIMKAIPKDGIPARFSLNQKNMFIIGYYHERNYSTVPKDDMEVENDAGTN